MLNQVKKSKMQIAQVLIVLVVAVMMSACASVKSHVRTDAQLPEAGKDKILIMPASIRGLPGDNLAQSAALFGGFMGAFKDQGVSLQPLQPVLEKAGMGNLSARMARGMYHMATFHNTYDFKEDAGYHGGQSELPLIIDGTAKLVSLASKKLKLKFKANYVAVVYVDGWRRMFGKMVKMRVIAGLYNTKTGKVEKVVYKSKMTSSNDKVILGELATLGGQLKDLLMAKAE